VSNVWLKCDSCNKDLRAAEVDQAMQLAVRFKPSICTQAIAQLHPQEHRQRCRSCGWVNVFVPSASVAAGREQISLLTPPRRTVTLKSQAVQN
jgi:hypothetical protein